MLIFPLTLELDDEIAGCKSNGLMWMLIFDLH